MNKEIYRRAKEFKRKYPMTIAFRLRAHALSLLDQMKKLNMYL